MPRPSLIGASVLLCALHLAWPAAQAQSQTRGAPATLAPVERFEVVGNTLLPQATIDTRLAAFKGATTLVRLREAAAAVQDLYRDAGYGGVIAFLPEQQAAPGQIRIRVVEGKLSLVEVADNRQFSAENIRASLPSLVTGVTPRVRQIDAEIQMANESPAKEVKVLLEPGQAPGSVAARVMVLEQPVQRWTARLDNTGVGNTGQWRSALGWQHGNLFGRDHVLGTEVQTAPANPSKLAVFSAAYRVPLYAQASALDAYAAWSDVDGGRSSTAAGDLLFSGKGRIAGLRATRYLPRVGNVDQRASLGVEQREFINQCSIEGLPPGACGPAGASVTVRPLALGYTAQAEGDTRFGLNVSAHANLQAGGSHAPRGTGSSSARGPGPGGPPRRRCAARAPKGEGSKARSWSRSRPRIAAMAAAAAAARAAASGPGVGAPRPGRGRRTRATAAGSGPPGTTRSMASSSASARSRWPASIQADAASRRRTPARPPSGVSVAARASARAAAA